MRLESITGLSVSIVMHFLLILVFVFNVYELQEGTHARGSLVPVKLSMFKPQDDANTEQAGEGEGADLAKLLAEFSLDKVPDISDDASMSAAAQQGVIDVLGVNYLIDLRYSIEKQKLKLMRQRGIKSIDGLAGIRFDLDKHGYINNIRLSESSGDPALDQLAIDAVKELGRFDAFPSSIKRDQWTMGYGISTNVN